MFCDCWLRPVIDFNDYRSDNSYSKIAIPEEDVNKMLKDAFDSKDITVKDQEDGLKYVNGNYELSLGNRGDEAAHRALVRGLVKKFPEAKIDIIFLNENQQMINDIIVNNGNVKYINYRGMNKASNKCMKLTMLRNNMYFLLNHI